MDVSLRRRGDGMARRFVDLSVALENDVPADPARYALQITYIDHRETAPSLAQRYGIAPAELMGGEAHAIETIGLNTHNGTHVDAPYHYGRRMDDGTDTRTIDELPLEWFFGAGVKLDFRHFPDGYVCTAADVTAELARIGHTLSAGDIVLINTSAGVRFGQPDYVQAGCGMGRDATLYLTSRGVRVAGTDAWSWDVSHDLVAERFRQSRDPSIIWEGHRAGLSIEYSHIEKLHNLEALPAHGFLVACFPVKIRGASAGWTRAVAIFDE